MNTPYRRILQGLALIALVLGLGSCSGLAEMMGLKDGADGAAGESIYLVANNVAGIQNLRVYSGGTVYVGQQAAAGTLSTTFALVNNSGHGISFEGASPKVSPGSYYFLNTSGYPLSGPDGFGFADETGLLDTIDSYASLGNSFIINFAYQSTDGIYYKEYTLYLKDVVTGETFSLSFAVRGLSGSLPAPSSGGT